MIDPKKDPKRRCLKVAEWPAPDRLAWKAALRERDIFDDERGPASLWVPATIHKNRRGYGRWLTFRQFDGGLDAETAPDARVSIDTVRAYLRELRAFGNSPYTVRNRISELLAVIQAFAPNRDWSWLRRLLGRLDREAYPIRDKAQRMVSAAEIYAWAFSTMDEADAHRPRSTRRHAAHFRDGLMVALLILCPAMRRRNLAAIVLARHLIHDQAGYRLYFPADEMKARRPLEERLPPELVRYLERYLQYHRPCLLNGQASDRLWISSRGWPMTAMAVYHRLVKVTQQAFGVAISPHLFRDCAATTIAIEDPSHVRIAAPVLGHKTFKTTERHYIQAHALQASRRFGATIRALRRKSAP